MRNRKTTIRFLLAAAVLCLLFASNAFAAKTKKKTAPRHVSEWVKKKGCMYYYNKKGKRLKGLQKIGKKTYYFDKSYAQRVGWRKIGSEYYFFAIRYGKKGYMLKNQTVNGIRLRKSGRAVQTEYALRKLGIMVKCAKIVDQQTNINQSKSEKLYTVFEHVKNDYSGRDIGGFNGSGDWEMRYSEYMLWGGWGDCYSFGSLFAFLANAVGYSECWAVSDGGHGYAKVGNLWYDPNWAGVIGTWKCYGVPDYLCGQSGRPNWARYALYYRRI